MKEDILEQVFDDWLLSQDCTFTKHNVKFKPNLEHEDYNSKKDSVNSDIDVLGVHLDKTGVSRVSAVSCKSWQAGFNPQSMYNNLLNNPNLISGGREIWKAFRELVNPKWGKAFSNKIYEETGSKDFTYYLFVTQLVGRDIEKSKLEFEKCEHFINNLKYDFESQIEIKIMTFKEVYEGHYKTRDKKTLEATELGRLMQIIRASGIDKLNLN
jgi:hypothetical protein